MTGGIVGGMLLVDAEPGSITDEGVYEELIRIVRRQRLISQFDSRRECGESYPTSRDGG